VDDLGDHDIEDFRSIGGFRSCLQFRQRDASHVSAVPAEGSIGNPASSTFLKSAIDLYANRAPAGRHCCGAFAWPPQLGLLRIPRSLNLHFYVVVPNVQIKAPPLA
jgi:hypothetical protein